MNTIQKFDTFESLKFIENKTAKNDTSNLKKHNDFEKVMMEIRFAKIQQDKLTKPKQ